MAVSRNDDLAVEVRTVGGGDTPITFHHYLPKERLHDKSRLFARVSVPVGGSIGLHQHTDESEFYVIHSGQGRYRMDDHEWDLVPGDVAEVAPGHSHGIDNTGDEPLEFTALIIFA
ncbi:MAG: cupin domain-containing protein [Beutenbergiaceae bacterium]